MILLQSHQARLNGNSKKMRVLYKIKKLYQKIMVKYFDESELNFVIPPEISNDLFSDTIYRLAKKKM